MSGKHTKMGITQRYVQVIDFSKLYLTIIYSLNFCEIKKNLKQISLVDGWQTEIDNADFINLFLISTSMVYDLIYYNTLNLNTSKSEQNKNQNHLRFLSV